MDLAGCFSRDCDRDIEADISGQTNGVNSAVEHILCTYPSAVRGTTVADWR